MLSFTRNNGPYQQDGRLAQSPPAASQFNFNTIGNQQTGNANRSQYTHHYGAESHHYGADSQRQPSKWQTSAGPHQAVFFQQTAGSDDYQQRSPTNGQTGNFKLHDVTGQNSLIKNPPNVMLAKEVLPQQVNSANWNQSVGVYGKQSITTQQGNVSDRLNCRGEKRYFLNPNRKSVLPVYTTATSPQHGAVAYDGSLGPAAAHHGPTAQNSPKQNHTQHCVNPPSYWPVYNKTTHSSSSGHNLQVSSTSLICQQSSTHNNGGETAGFINSKPNNWQHETNFSPSKPNNYPLNPAAQQDRLRRQTIARIEDYLRTPIAAGSDGQPQGNTSSSYGPKKNVTTLTSTVAKILNANASQAIRQNSRHPLPQTTPSVVSAQRCADPRLQQSSVPNVSATQHGNHGEMPSAKISDRSSLLSHGCTRVVAVVQPLSQGSYQVAGQQSGSNAVEPLSEGAAADGSNSERSLLSPQKQLGFLKVGHSSLPENPNQITSSQYEILLSAVYNNGTFGLSSSAGPQHIQQKQSTVAARSELDVDTQVHNCVATTAQQQSITSKAPVSPNCDMDLIETTNKTNGDVELSPVLKAPLKTVTLSKYIQDCEEAQIKLKDFTTCSPTHKLLRMFWDDDVSKLACALKNGMYSTLMNEVQKVCREHSTIESMSVVWGSWSAVTELKNYRVLKDTNVYKERPYKSLWLNVNEQLDDIDKEFDFPQSLKYHRHTIKNVSQPCGVEKEGHIPAQAVNEAPNQMSSTELQQVELNEEKQDPSVEATLTQTAAPIVEDTDSSDPYSFQIQVLTPEDAKDLFKQLIKDPPESMDMDHRSMEVELPDVLDLTQSDSKLDKTFCPIEEICCVERWMENILGSNTALSKCKCQKNQRQKELRAETIDKEGTAAQETDAFSPDRKSPPPAAAGENQAVSGESVDNQVSTFDWPVIVDVFSENVGIPGDHDKPPSYADRDPENIHQISIDSGQSSILVISDDEELSGIESNSGHAQVDLTRSGQSNGSDGKETNIILEINSDSEVEFLPYESENTPSSTLIKSDQKIKNPSSGESDSAIQMTDLKENCGQAQAASTDETESSLETEEEMKSAAAARQKPRGAKLKRPRGADRFLPASKKCNSPVDVNSQPSHEDASKRVTVSFRASDGEPSPLSRPTVDLVLFGSRTQDSGVVGRKNHTSSPDAGSDAVPTPPKCLTVNLSPLKKKTIKTVLTWECSVKRLYKKWNINFPPAKIKHKIKRRKGSFASSSKWTLEKAGKAGPAHTDQRPVFSKKRIFKGKTKPCPNLHWRKPLSEELKREEEKTQTLNHPDGQEGNNGGSDSVAPLQINSALKYSVLPVSFIFGSNGMKETKDSVPEKANVDGKDHRPNQTVVERSTWCPMTPTKSLFSPPTPKTRSLFHMFQKKYMEKVKPLGDK
ncbi:uncharacterized protein si:ch211-106e7.2 [Pungitius pungitius]|uniref:uncharacterized protein si:ch211-106e7.2 n=1 Tax=Pungitius pungitius TaxID=134920 RepID=UPI002E147FB6